MFLELVTPPPPAPPTFVQANVDSLFLYHPLQVSALVELVWSNRYNAASTPFVPWGSNFINTLLTDAYSLGGGVPEGQSLMPGAEVFVPPIGQPGTGTATPTNWDHLIYAYLVENTRIFDIFGKVLDAYMFSERLETPSPATQQFLRNTEYLMYSDGLPTMVWTTASRLRRDEIANRLTTYYRMFGVDLSHSREIMAQHPYEKPAVANTDFIATFEVFASETWKGIENAKNTSGAKPTDDEAISTAARRIYDMMATRRLGGNLSREEFRAVAIMSWLHLAVMYDSPIVQDLRATASSPEQRLQKIADRVGMSAHTRSKPLFDLSQPFSFLMQSIETGAYNTPGTTAILYTPGTAIETNAEIVIDQYYLATGRNLKAAPITINERALMPRQPPPRAITRGNTQATRASAP